MTTDAGSPRRIEVRAGELPRMAREAETALIETGAGIYQRGGQLVRVVTLDAPLVDRGIRRAGGSRVIIPVIREYLQLSLARAATWTRYDARARKHVEIDPPAAVASALLAASGEWRLPFLAGIVTAPTLRRDGSLLQAPGYDEASHLYAAFDAGDFPAIAAQPSRADALDALAMLRDTLDEFAYSTGADGPHASVLLAAIITAVVRPALEIAPAFGMSAHKAGSGKTTAAKIPAQIVLGHDPAVICPGEDEEELRKALLAVLMAGDGHLVLDNLERPLSSAALCAVLTAATYRDRVLGESRTVTVPTSATWMLTGNALELVGDLTTRALVCTLDPEVENPEAREFKRDLAAYVIANRAALLSAALCIPLAYLASGSPPVEGRSRFHDWDRLVRAPLMWLGAADPLLTQAELRGIDPAREALVAVLHAWRDAFGDAPTTVATAMHAASDNEALREALQGVAADQRGVISNKRLGRYLTRSLRRIEDGVRLEDGGRDLATNRRRFGVTSVSGVCSLPTRANVNDKTVDRREPNTGNTSNTVCRSCDGEGCVWCR